MKLIKKTKPIKNLFGDNEKNAASVGTAHSKVNEVYISTSAKAIEYSQIPYPHTQPKILASTLMKNYMKYLETYKS